MKIPSAYKLLVKTINNKNMEFINLYTFEELLNLIKNSSLKFYILTYLKDNFYWINKFEISEKFYDENIIKEFYIDYYRVFSCAKMNQSMRFLPILPEKIYCSKYYDKEFIDNFYNKTISFVTNDLYIVDSIEYENLYKNKKIFSFFLTKSFDKEKFYSIIDDYELPKWMSVCVNYLYQTNINLNKYKPKEIKTGYFKNYISYNLSLLWDYQPILFSGDIFFVYLKKGRLNEV